MKDLCKVLKNDSMAHSSPMTTITSQPENTLASIVIQSVVSPQTTVVITDCELEHSLDCPEVRNISTSAMRLQATEVLSTVPNVRPSSLVNLARLKHGVACSYSSAWRAMQCYRQDISKADVISFGQIPYFLHEIEIANPGSTTYVAATSEGIFDNAFLCLGPMRNAFNQCRPMLIADACHIEKQIGVVLSWQLVHMMVIITSFQSIAIGLYDIENEMN
ncbi:hypothetical protein BASA61_003824 [Batrachochytrium salamandrivorans]|nr:hypothetical protein BASA61_003824 [Batrachochytrium salamandrivorans]